MVQATKRVYPEDKQVLSRVKNIAWCFSWDRPRATPSVTDDNNNGLGRKKINRTDKTSTGREGKHFIRILLISLSLSLSLYRYLFLPDRFSPLFAFFSFPSSPVKIIRETVWTRDDRSMHAGRIRDND